MSTPNQKQWQLQTRHLQRAVWGVLILLIITLAAFGGYYYWDRYVHLGDVSPLDSAINELEQAIHEDPQNPETRVTLAEFYLAQNMYSEAIDQTGQVLSIYPENESALLISGLAYARSKEPQAAVEPLEQFVALRKDRPMANTDTTLEMAYYFLGESYVELNKPMAAISVLEAALVINRFDADALYKLGQAYQADDRPEAAIDAYHQAVRFVPDFTEAYSGMIESYAALQQSDLVAYARGMEALTLSDYETAQTHLEYATQVQPDFSPAFLGLALTYEKMGQMEAAQVAIQQAIDLNPDDFAAQQTFGRIQSVMN